MWKNILELDRTQVTIWKYDNKAVNTHSEYVMLIAFLRQQWLHERASLLCYTYFACIVFSCGATAQLRLGRLSVEVSRSHTHIHTHTHTHGGTPLSDQLVAEAAADTTNTRDEYPHPQRVSNP